MRTLQRSVLLASFLTVAAVARADSRDPIRYTLRFPAPQTNYLEVEAVVPTDGRPSVEMFMAVWTPGSYLIREYARNVEGVSASAGGRGLAIEKTLKNRWRVTTGGAREVTITYRVFSHEMTVRSNWVDTDVAMINGAPTFMTLAPASDNSSTAAGPPKDPPYNRPHDVRLELPHGWTSITGMPDAPGGGPNHYLAPDFDTLVDSPIVAGTLAIHRFTVSGKPHFLVDVSEAGVFDGARAAHDLERIVQTDEQLWGSLPYDKYVFFNLLTGASGGLEHRNSVMMMASRWAMGSRARYLNWLSLASHEYFHLWNVKRLRPIELGPFDYEHEVYPRSLWISEGLTDYYGDLQVRRAGLSSPGEYLSQLSDAIKALQSTPGRLTQTAEMASFDAWIKQYRPDENSLNSSISYYTKGNVLGWLLDARIRAATHDAKSLDDVMRLAFGRYAGARGFTPEEFRQVAAEVGGAALGAWFTQALDSTDELDYSQALDWFGLEFAAVPPPPDPPGWLGARVKVDAGRLVVENVPRGTPALDAGVNPGDELIAIDDFRVAPEKEKLDERLQSYKPGQHVTLLVARLEALKRLNVTLGQEPADRWTLSVKSDRTPEQQAHLMNWLR
ncbi:MAG TPA: PDZ domain-containing protein [Vicinamibacterales bacterium]|nr:PDZ domain-containing protein [Vicinamibacterales bacterium]